MGSRPLEGSYFIRSGLLAYIAEKTEMTARGGKRDHRLRVIFRTEPKAPR